MTGFPGPDITLDVNLANPGQFFACCGVLELANRLWPGRGETGWRSPEGWFALDEGRATFAIATYSGDNDPLGAIVAKLVEGEPLVALAADHEPYAGDRKPIVLGEPFNLRLDWWLDSYRGGDKSEMKVWAGQQTPLRNFEGLRNAWRDMIAANAETMAPAQILSRKWPMTGRFGFDPAAAPTSLDVGFSTDEQGIPVLTSPATEMLAAIGLQRCRPVRDDRSRGRWFIYRAWADPLAINVAPAAIADVGRAVATNTFPVTMRNSQYGNFGWAKRWESRQ